jgi:hypothetical protein
VPSCLRAFLKKSNPPNEPKSPFIVPKSPLIAFANPHFLTNQTHPRLPPPRDLPCIYSLHASRLHVSRLHVFLPPPHLPSIRTPATRSIPSDYLRPIKKDKPHRLTRVGNPAFQFHPIPPSPAPDFPIDSPPRLSSLLNSSVSVSCVIWLGRCDQRPMLGRIRRNAPDTFPALIAIHWGRRHRGRGLSGWDFI